jgi:hypothetical protein
VIWREYREGFGIDNKGAEGGWAVGHSGWPRHIYRGEELGLWVEIEHGVRCQFSDTNIGSGVKGCSDKMNTGRLCYGCIWRPSSSGGRLAHSHHRISYILHKAFKGRHVTGKHVIGRHVIGRHFIWIHFTGRHVTGRHVIGRHVTGRRVIERHFIWIHFTGRQVTGRHVIGRHVTGRLIGRHVY